MPTYILIVENRPPRALERYVETHRGEPEIGIRGYDEPDQDFADSDRSTFQTITEVVTSEQFEERVLAQYDDVARDGAPAAPDCAGHPGHVPNWNGLVWRCNGKHSR